MAVPNLGQVEIDGTTYTLQDVLGGGTASLAKDPVIAMKVISQAIDDVSTLRARIGAFQKNMLQTNVNSLNVAVENITATESAIRDANMATESAEYSKNQILVQAGTAMLAQANTISQNVLQLLGG
jgi:flagellin